MFEQSTPFTGFNIRGREVVANSANTDIPWTIGWSIRRQPIFVFIQTAKLVNQAMECDYLGFFYD